MILQHHRHSEEKPASRSRGRLSRKANTKVSRVCGKYTQERLCNTIKVNSLSAIRLLLKRSLKP